MTINAADKNNGIGGNKQFSDLFAHGARRVRADFHLHTEQDGQFATVPEGVSFHRAWVDRLAEEDIRLGVITNHNKFVQDEYKTLRKEAGKKGIFILPGVELCVQGGKSGIHILIGFDPATWIFNKENEDFINRFLDNGFPHTPNRDSEDSACQWTLSQTLDKLERHRENGRDSFVILAHVDDIKGAFKEMGGGLSSQFSPLFERSVLAVQKSRSRDNWDKLRQWVNTHWVPAKVEGSDCKSLDTVGRAHAEGDEDRKCYLKLGAFSFQAVRLALIMKAQRVSENLPEHQAAYIRSVTFKGGHLGGQTLFLNPDMNNFIGIRGSGKSSVLECLRYLLNIDLKPSDEDTAYKEELVKRTLTSGGKVSAELITADNKAYRFDRILGDSPHVSIDGESIPDLRPQSLLKVRYFGQKDLAKFSEQQFARDLIERFTEQKGEKEEEIQRVRHRIEQRLVAIAQNEKHLEKIDEVKAELAAVNESLKKFDEQNLHEKLKAQIALENDVKEAGEIVSLQKDTIDSLRRWYEDYAPVISQRLSKTAPSENDTFKQVTEGLKRFEHHLGKLDDFLSELEAIHKDTIDGQSSLKAFLESRKEEFAEIRRTLKLEGDLNPDTYVELTKKKKLLTARLSELENIQKKKDTAEKEMLKDLVSLQSLWNEEFQERMREVKKLNQVSSEITIKLGFKEDKESFVQHLSAFTSGIQKRTLKKVCDVLSDGVELYLDLFAEARRLADEAELNQAQIARLHEAVNQNLKSIITFRPPDSVNILYKNKPLHEHSLGQRATALMLFLLGQEDFDVLIIDQPEDDLDNQTIYEEVIRRLLDLKGKRQVIFATHSPNIPVLGDAEQIFRCEFSPNAIQLLSGSIDSPEIQQEVVRVMEGGKDAFRKRKQIYEAWTH